jgi:polyisoprenoid-binding protein YceI
VTTPGAAFGRLPLKGATPADRRSRLRGVRVVALVLTASTVYAEPAVYRLDPTHSFVHFEVVHFGTSTLHGRFGPVAGEVTLDREVGRGQVSLAIETASVNTGTAALDARLRERDLLASAEQPQAFFVAEQFTFDGSKLKEVRGEFTLRGISQPLSLKALRFNCYTSPLVRREVCGGDFEAQFERSSVGATLGLPFVADRVRLLIEVEGIRQ